MKKQYVSPEVEIVRMATPCLMTSMSQGIYAPDTGGGDGLGDGSEQGDGEYDF